MRRTVLLCCLAGAAPTALAWEFGAATTIAAPAEGVFHHLEAAGRASLAVTATGAVLTWEDNRNGRPVAWASWSSAGGEDGFAAPQQLSGGADAYEPAVAAFGEGAVFAWEEDGRLQLRAGTARRLGPVQQVGGPGAAQPTLASAAQGTYLSWVEPDGRHRRVMVALLHPGAAGLEVQAPRPVEAQAPAGDQLYPALAVTEAGTVVAWEDRRAGHTRLYASFAPHGGEFGPPRPLNELLEARSAEFGRGSGVTRVALASAGKRVLAVWMDKRNFEGGYKIYAALSEDGGRHFGRNEEVQDPFGDNVPQWHPDVAVSPAGQMVVAWDDRRDETADLWLSWRTESGEWSDDLAIAPGHGPGEQTHPVITFDAQGVLHVAWVSRDAEGTRLVYTRGQPD